MELNEKDLENVVAGVNYETGKEMFNNVRGSNGGEISEEQLENVMAGMNFTAGIDKTLENGELFRKKQIEELNKMREELNSYNEEKVDSGRSR